MIDFYKLIIICLFITSCSSKKPTSADINLTTEELVIEKIAEHTYRHISYLKTNDFGKVACNGLIVMDGQEAIIFDTPTDNKGSVTLINWVQENLHCKVKAVVATHFHEDCLGGLPAFHQFGIPSYANKLTIALATKKNTAVPQHGFDQTMVIALGKEQVLLDYFGEGHTRDNITGYFPADKVLFGGCLIKELGAGKGNLEDANTSEWPSTVQKLKNNYSDTKIVVPGHGKPGDVSLLDYTIHLFASN